MQQKVVLRCSCDIGMTGANRQPLDKKSNSRGHFKQLFANGFEKIINSDTKQPTHMLHRHIFAIHY